MTGPPTELQAFGALQRFARRPAPGERCELCGAGVPTQHEHLIEIDKRRLACACQACAILFSSQSIQRYKRVTPRVRTLDPFRITDAEWQGLMVPINMAFFFHSESSGKIVAMYPSPAGATEAEVPLKLWREIATGNPALDAMESDVEALLVNRLGEQRGFSENRYFLVSIDRCFQLVGLVRTHWRGLSGGSELWTELRRYFDDLRAGAPAEAQHA